MKFGEWLLQEANWNLYVSNKDGKYDKKKVMDTIKLQNNPKDSSIKKALQKVGAVSSTSTVQFQNTDSNEILVRSGLNDNVLFVLIKEGLQKIKVTDKVKKGSKSGVVISMISKTGHYSHALIDWQDGKKPTEELITNIKKY